MATLWFLPTDSPFFRSTGLGFACREVIVASKGGYNSQSLVQVCQFRIRTGSKQCRNRIRNANEGYSMRQCCENGIETMNVVLWDGGLWEERRGQA